MTERYIAFDVETPNHENSRMCALGITVIDDGIITKELYYTINPGTYFDMFNIMLTGISPETVSESPNFVKVWSEISDLFSTGILVAHNAPFDMSVLAKCLRDYRLPHPRALDYVCTCRMARKCCPEFPNHKLDTLCREIGIELSHHNAASDSKACAMLLLEFMKCGTNPRDFIKTYDILECKTLQKKRF